MSSDEATRDGDVGSSEAALVLLGFELGLMDIFLLVALGIFGYYWFFMREKKTDPATQFQAYTIQYVTLFFSIEIHSLLIILKMCNPPNKLIKNGR